MILFVVDFVNKSSYRFELRCDVNKFNHNLEIMSDVNLFNFIKLFLHDIEFYVSTSNKNSVLLIERIEESVTINLMWCN